MRNQSVTKNLIYQTLLHFITSTFSEAFSNIKANLLRTLLSILGIVIGVAALVVILSFIDGMEKYALSQISSTTSLETIMLASDKRERVDGVLMKKENLSVLTIDEFLEMSEQLSLVEKSYAIYRKSGMIYHGDSSVGGKVRFLTRHEGLDYEVVAGDLADSETFDKTSRIAVVNENLANSLFPNQAYDDIVGMEIKFDTLTFSIGAVIATDEKNTASFFAPYTILPQSFKQTNEPSMMIKAANINDVPIIKKQLEDWFIEHLGEGHDMNVITNEFRVEQVNKGFLLFRLIMGLIVGISVVVGGIGVMNVMIISVTERIKEIGIRKATGARKKVIMWQFLSESITISVFGSFVGLLVGMGFTLIAVPIVKSITEAPFEAAFTFNTLFIITVIAILTGVVFGTYPAIKASKLNPVDAIRHE